ASTGLPSPGCGSTPSTTTEQSHVLQSIYTQRRTIIMTTTSSATPKSDLLDTVITAHGDLDRWRSLDQLTAKVSAGGVLWGLKGQPGILKDYTLTLTPNLQSDTLAPFAAPNLRATYTPERVAIETVDGRLVEERTNPRASFNGHTLQTPWCRLHTAS